jgi:isoaspartyl peptidase/L-asparaginase-like protein (Ntn-hydrolase superfamily)
VAERPSWALILHGGARTIAPGDADANRAGCLAAAEVGAAMLRDGGSAEAAVEAVIRVLESDATFNAGHGAVANADGVVQLDAAIMRGKDLAIGAVGALEGVLHPISVARRLLDETPALLVGDGARAFAARSPEPQASPPASRTPAAGGDTVGCIALDRDGHLAAGLSTGGLEGKMPGRLGDTPLPGCGFYADDRTGAVALSGDGDSILRVLLAARVMAGLEGSSPQIAAEAGLTHLSRVGGDAGAIVLDPAGGFGCAHTSKHFAVAFASNRLAPRAILNQDEWEPFNG